MTTEVREMTVELTPELMRDIVVEAKTAARHAASKYFSEVLGNEDKYSCGFAWVNLYRFNGRKIDGRSKVAKILKAAGVERSWNKMFQLWNPSSHLAQNIDTKVVGAEAAAEVFKKYGFEAYAGSRLD